jgi:drug/metabolite transporter (DMT)-like permease
MALPPVILIPLGYLLYGERVGRRGIVGTLVAFCGVALIFLVG